MLGDFISKPLQCILDMIIHMVMFSSTSLNIYMINLRKEEN